MSLFAARRISRELIHRLAVGATLLLLAGLYADGWWHGTFGRHSFWIPPHVVIYTGVVVLAATVAARWRLDRAEGGPLPAGYRVLGLAILVTLAAAPFDEWWHRTFGEELATSPLSIWSPPHLAGLLSAIAGGLGVLSTMVREDPGRRLHWWMVAQGGAVVGFATFVIIPLEPTGFYRVAGLAGPWVITFFLVGLRLLAVSLLRGPAVASGIALVVTPLVILLTRAPSLAVPPPPPMPPWVVVLPALAGALLLDLLAHLRPEGTTRPHTLGRWGVVYTALFAALFYPAANAALWGGWTALEVGAMVAGSALMGYPAGLAAWWAARRLAARPTAESVAAEMRPAEARR